MGGPGAYDHAEGGRCGTCIKITKWLPVLFILSVISWSYYAFVVQLVIFTMQEIWLQVIFLSNKAT